MRTPEEIFLEAEALKNRSLELNAEFMEIRMKPDMYDGEKLARTREILKELEDIAVRMKALAEEIKESVIHHTLKRKVSNRNSNTNLWDLI